MVLKGEKMTVLELLKIASSYLAIDKDLEIFFEESDTTSATDEAKDKFSKLLLAFNNIINELALHKAPPTKIAKIQSSFGTNEIDLSEQNCNKVVCVQSASGEKLAFLQSGTKVLFNGFGEKVFIEYSFVPNIYKADDDLDIFTNFGKSLLATGIASEYCYLNEILDDAKDYREKFDAGLKLVLSKNKLLPRRDFV